MPNPKVDAIDFLHRHHYKAPYGEGDRLWQTGVFERQPVISLKARTGDGSWENFFAPVYGWVKEERQECCAAAEERDPDAHYCLSDDLPCCGRGINGTTTWRLSRVRARGLVRRLTEELSTTPLFACLTLEGGDVDGLEVDVKM